MELGSPFPPPTPQEAAALIAAIERFLADHRQPAALEERQQLDGWRRQALLEGVNRLNPFPGREPWLEG
jgi:hypothetical protein